MAGEEDTTFPVSNSQIGVPMATLEVWLMPLGVVGSGLVGTALVSTPGKPGISVDGSGRKGVELFVPLGGFVLSSSFFFLLNLRNLLGFFLEE